MHPIVITWGQAAAAAAAVISAAAAAAAGKALGSQAPFLELVVEAALLLLMARCF